MPNLQRYLTVIATAAILVSTATAAAFLGPNAPTLPGRGEDAAAAPPQTLEDHAAHRERPGAVEKSPDGVIPTREDAALRMDRRDRITIRDDADWNPANGVSAGTGTPSDPFVIDGWNVDVVLIAETQKCFEFKENWVGRILILDWSGPCGLVHHNHLENFRTNRNVERQGDPTAAVITLNAIKRVEELRHFDGVLTDNLIGTPPAINDAPVLGDVVLPRNGVALNIAGLNGADIARNTIYGGVDMKLHGHHHADEHGVMSHNHGAADAAQNDSRDEVHSERYVNFLFHDNTIIDNGFGLRYNDLNHAGDDRQATSEQEPMLESPHYHYTTVRIANNVIDGRGLRVSIFNSPDERHLGNQGTLILEGNIIREPAAGSAVLVSDIEDANVVVGGNSVEPNGLRLSDATGIMLQRFKNSTVMVSGNTLPGFGVGVAARDFDERTTWTVVGNAAPDAEHDVYWDGSVANPPNGEAPAEAPGDEHAGHEHGEHEHGDHEHDREAAAPRSRLDAARAPSVRAAPSL